MTVKRIERVATLMERAHDRRITMGVCDRFPTAPRWEIDVANLEQSEMPLARSVPNPLLGPQYP
jgi:hypothetical protein